MTAGTGATDDRGDAGAEHPPPWATDLIEALQRQHRVVDEQAAVIDAQRAELAAVHDRLDRLERFATADERSAGDRRTDPPTPVTSWTGVTTGVEPPADRSAGDDALPEPALRTLADASTSRRNLLTRGAAVAAGAAVAGTVLNVAGASPAAAAAGSFDGNPAVLGTAAPTNGVGVKGVSGTGIGVFGSATATSGPGTGVNGQSGSPTGVGVAGDNFATTGLAQGVRGYTASTGGRGVYGWSTATDGTAAGIEGAAASPDSVGVLGSGTATTGDAVGVRGTSAGSSGHGVEGIASATTGNTQGVRGQSSSPSGVGVLGLNLATNGEASGLFGRTASNDGIAVQGYADATSGSNTGVFGVSGSPAGQGVRGVAAATGGLTFGVVGRAVASATGTGVRGDGGSSGFGLAASGGAAAVYAFSTTCQLLLGGAPTPPLTAGRTSSVGSILTDLNGDLWTCVTTGTPGTWRRIAGPSTAGALVLLPSPVRVYDSRAGEPPTTAPKTPLAPRTARTVDLTLNSSGVPAGATGALVSLIAVDHTSGGFLAAYRNGNPFPGTSNLTFEAGLNPSVTTVVALSPSGRIALYANVTTDVVVDVVGWYQ